VYQGAFFYFDIPSSTRIRIRFLASELVIDLTFLRAKKEDDCLGERDERRRSATRAERTASLESAPRYCLDPLPRQS